MDSNSQKIAIIDYGMGNLRSILNAFRSIGADPFIAEIPEHLQQADRIVLPGVGAFRTGMQYLHKKGWVPIMEEQVFEKRKPFLGICLGMQLIASFSEEHGHHEGLGWIQGKVTKLNSKGLPLPHIGWNDVTIVDHKGLCEGMGAEEAFYFIHSFVFRPEDSSVITGLCSHGETFTASVSSGNIHATQYHPEKSHKKGLKLLTNFIRLD
jgi:imidazole glycerol-phosphate synthase subunit HisH